jgi:hypothetical protein
MDFCLFLFFHPLSCQSEFENKTSSIMFIISQNKLHKKFSLNLFCAWMLFSSLYYFQATQCYENECVSVWVFEWEFK